MLKTCTKCKIEKDSSEFSKDKGKRDGLSCWCKSCQKTDKEKNKLRNQQYQKEYDARRRESRLKYPKIYYEDHSAEGLKYCVRCQKLKSFNEFHKAKSGRFGLSSICKNCQQLYDKERYATKERKEYNRNKYNEFKDVYNKAKSFKYKSDINFRVSRIMSVNIRSAIKKDKAERHWENLVPYTLQELKDHLESQFTSEMSWDNYGSYWEIDHIIPQNTFNITSSEDTDFKICWSLANLRPLTTIENRSRPKDGSDISEELKQQILKGDKYKWTIN